MTTDTDLLISVIAPVYNEEEVIEEYTRVTLDILNQHYKNFELLFIDDGSKDSSVEKIKNIQKTEKNIRLIRLSRNYGHELAMTAGFQNCVGDIVIIMDSDLQDPPKLIPELVSKLLEEDADVCYAARSTRKGESWLKKYTSTMFYRICSKFTGFEIPDNAGDFRAMRRKVIDSINQVKEKVRYMKMLYAYVGFKTTSVPFEREARFKGETKYTYIKLIDAALDAIVSNSHKPLRYVSVGSVMVSFVMLLLSMKGLIDRFFIKDLDHLPTLFFVTTFMFSLLFVVLAVFSEYISRILVESKDRPLYYIMEDTKS